MYDVIGDVHGQGEKLRALLRSMGYTEGVEGWRAPAGRQAIFVGDLIDRGPEQLGVLKIVRQMIEDGYAQMVLGNHEFNAIGYATLDEMTGDHYRPRSPKNRKQHARFIEEVGEDSAVHKDWVDWFRKQPLALDLNGIRVAHAWWDQDAFELIDNAWRAAGNWVSDEFLRACHRPGPLKEARKVFTCGVEWELPFGAAILDKEGHRHGEARLAVWRHWAGGLRDIAIVPAGSEDSVPAIDIPLEHRLGEVVGAPILFGHHWFSGTVKLETPKVACLDWSAARDGPLVAYRWGGESELREENLIAVGA